MEDQPFFLTLAGLAVSLAGFASLIAWLRTDATRWDAINLWRVKTIVRHALGLAFLCLVLVPTHALTGSTAASVAVGSGTVAGFILYDILGNRRRDPTIWDPAATWRIFMVGSGLMLALQLVNLWAQSLGILQLGLVLALISPAGIFYNFIRELGSSQPATE